MIEVVVGNDLPHINTYLQNLDITQISYDSSDTLNDILQESLFPATILIKDYKEWTPKDRKRLIAWEGNNHLVFQVDKLPKKDPLQAYPTQEFSLPKDRPGWNNWLDGVAAELGVAMNARQRAILLSSLGEDPWSLYTELQKWAIAGVPSQPLQINESMPWAWAASLIAGEQQANAQLIELEQQAPLFLLATVGNRLYAQICRFAGADAQEIGINAYPWRLAGEAKRYGWNQTNSQYWLKELLRTEAQMKGVGGGDLPPFVLLALWQSQLLENHPRKS